MNSGGAVSGAPDPRTAGWRSAGVALLIINKGSILGGGGTGGSGGLNGADGSPGVGPTSGNPGAAGGDALRIVTALAQIGNGSGKLWGGGGGGRGGRGGGASLG